MKKCLAFLIIVAFASLTTCENWIMEKWWVEDERQPGSIVYVPGDTVYIEVPGGEKIVYIDVIHEVVTTIIEEHWNTISVYIPVVTTPPPPELIAERIEILGIDFILFSGDQDGYNEGPYMGAVSFLTPAEKARNDEIIKAFGEQLYDQWMIVEAEQAVPGYDPGAAGSTIPYFLLLHGHANPVDNTAAERAELRDLSIHRSNAVQNAVTGLNFPLPSPPPTEPTIPYLGAHYPLAANGLIGTGLYNTAAHFATTDFGALSPLTPITNPATGVPGPTVTIPTTAGERLDNLANLISIRGYGGGKTLIGSTPTYAALNRRVEAILFTIHREKSTVPPIIIEP